MSKRQFAQSLVDKFCERENIEIWDARNYISSSSELAVALEYLGLLKDEDLWYSKQRGGCAFTYFGDEDDSPAILTIREIMSFLPDEDVIMPEYV